MQTSQSEWRMLSISYCVIQPCGSPCRFATWFCTPPRQCNTQYYINVMTSSIKVRASEAPMYTHFITTNALWPVGLPVQYVCMCGLTCNCCASVHLWGNPPTPHTPSSTAEPMINETANAGNVIADKFHAQRPCWPANNLICLRFINDSPVSA